jgi:hypothetical protein
MTIAGGTIMTAAEKSTYRATESKYKGGASEMYVTYDLEQRTRGGGSALLPKVKRVYIAGDVEAWRLGEFRKRSGRAVHGVQIEYQQSRRPYRREGFRATRGQTEYTVPPSAVRQTTQRFAQIVELPERARNVRFHAHAKELPEPYRHALQSVR